MKEQPKFCQKDCTCAREFDEPMCSYKNYADSYSCNADDCGWIGPWAETVHPKHDTFMLLCPQCHETTERVTK